jgi:hypothetical protein
MTPAHNALISGSESVAIANGVHDLTRHKISDREPDATCHAAKGWMANTHDVSRSLARGSLHRLVRRHGLFLNIVGIVSASIPFISTSFSDLTIFSVVVLYF